MAGGAAALMDERGRMWGIPFSIVVMIIMCSSFSSWYAQPGHDDLMKKMQQKLSQLLQWCGAVQRTYAPSTVASMQMVMRFLAHWATMMKAKTRGLCAAVMRQHSLTTQPSSTSSSPLASVRQPLTKGERGSSTPARRSAHRSSAEQRRSREGVAAAITLVEEASAATPSRSSARMHQHRSSDREACVGDDATSNVVVAMRDASPAPSPIEPHTSHDARSQLPISRVAPPPPQRGCGDALPRSAWVQMGNMRMQLHPDYICVGQHLSFPLSTRMYEHRHTGVSISLSMEEVTSASHRSVMDVEGYVRRSVDRVLDRANACRTYTNVLVKTLANNVATTIFESYLEMEVGPSPIVAISFFAMMNHVAYILQLHVRQRDVEQYLPDLLMAAQTAMVEHSSPPPYSFNEFYIPTTTTTTVGGCRVAVALDFTVDQCDDRRLLLRHKFSAWEATLIVGGAPINDNTSSSSHVVRLSDAYNILLLPEMNVGMEAEARDEVMAFFMDTCVCDGIDDPVTVGHRAASHVVGEVFSLPLPPPSSIITDVCKHLFDAATTLFLQPRQPASMVKKKFADNNNNKLYRMDICFITCTAPNERGNTNTNHHHHHHTSVSSAVEALRQRLATVTAAELHHDPHMCAADDDDNDACVVLSAVERIKSTVVMVDARLADARRGNWFIAKWSYRGEEGEVLPDSLKDYRRSVLFDTVWMNPDGCWG